MKQPLRVHWLQHAEHEELGCIALWLEQRGYPTTRTRLHQGERLPAVEQFDWLIAMGGPMNIYEYDRYPWLAAEKALIGEALAGKKRILGICLGAQLLAHVMGGKVTRNRVREIGFFEVSLTTEGRNCNLLSGLPDRFPTFHWHGDTFSIPPGCTNLIKSDACVNQAFAVGASVLGLQFHPEVTDADVERWLATEDLRPDRYVQDAAQILSRRELFAHNNALILGVLERMA